MSVSTDQLINLRIQQERAPVQFFVLRKKLLSLGGEEVVYQSAPSWQLNLVVQFGSAAALPITLCKGRPSSCHQNVSLLWWADDSIELISGYALSADGLWRQHTWGVRDGTCIETTLSRQIYFGVKFTGILAMQFVLESAQDSLTSKSPTLLRCGLMAELTKAMEFGSVQWKAALLAVR